MINLLYEPLPDYITVGGRRFGIITDFREWFRFADMIHDGSLSDREKLSLMTLYLDEPPESVSTELVRAVFAFYAADALDSDTDNQSDGPDDDTADAQPLCRPPVFDWKYDAKFLLADFRRFYGINLLDAVLDMHWWEFRSLFAALPDDSQCMKRISIRSTDLGSIKNDAYRAKIARLQRLIALPYEMSDDEISAVFDIQ